ncbi:hypothetical protein DMB95_02530 [Campylobacter sp. MIT 12-8780]|uniref:hypothetical protein n=1 Tax=unclassified Campylobacter TaxID=2593542 RepID=UPI00115F58E6|nr:MULTISPECIES: hypothetical protein [unclassified Campylobacter]NDJ26660.1 hypothetical protein [Campylobacter sp. MIT 19-121]TQR42511.1 hypothetical protein DMB95_02530 [Campylobacter sp. MIT 12-8780]
MRFTIILLSFFLLSCSIPLKKGKSEPVYVSLKVQGLRNADFGFLYEKQKGVSLELYKLAQVLLRLKIEDKICLEQACFEKKAFNQRYLGQAYYDDFLEDILRFKPLFEGKNLVQNACGFSQNLQGVNYDISYQVCDKEMLFIEKKNNIRLSIKKVDNE